MKRLTLVGGNSYGLSTLADQICSQVSESVDVRIIEILTGTRDSFSGKTFSKQVQVETYFLGASVGLWISAIDSAERAIVKSYEFGSRVLIMGNSPALEYIQERLYSRGVGFTSIWPTTYTKKSTDRPKRGLERFKEIYGEHGVTDTAIAVLTTAARMASGSYVRTLSAINRSVQKFRVKFASDAKVKKYYEIHGRQLNPLFGDSARHFLTASSVALIEAKRFNNELNCYRYTTPKKSLATTELNQQTRIILLSELSGDLEEFTKILLRDFLIVFSDLKIEVLIRFHPRESPEKIEKLINKLRPAVPKLRVHKGPIYSLPKNEYVALCQTSTAIYDLYNIAPANLSLYISESLSALAGLIKPDDFSSQFPQIPFYVINKKGKVRYSQAEACDNELTLSAYLV